MEDYEPKIIKREDSIVTIELTPKENAPVVWGKIVLRVDTKTYTSLKDIFYDEEGSEVRYFIYEKVKKVGNYFIPTYWRVQASGTEERYTEIVIEEVEYDIEISEDYFTKSALKRFSK